MRLIHFICFAVLSISGLAKAQSENDMSFDAISGLKNVRSLAFDTKAETLFVTLPNRTLHFDLYPLRLKGTVEHEFTATSNGVSPEGDLFVVGEEERLDGKGRLFALGSVSSYLDTRESGLNVEPRTFDLDVAPLSGIAFDSSGTAYIQSATHHAVLKHQKKSFEFTNISLNCGPTAKFSVLEGKDLMSFVSMVATDDIVELGSISSDGDGTCIDGDRLSPQTTRSLTKSFSGSRVKDHSLIVAKGIEGQDQIRGSGVLIFDSENKHLTFFPIAEFDGEISLRRSAQTSYNMSGLFGAVSGNFGRIATDRTGETILVAAFDEENVHRLTWDGVEFEYQGEFKMGASVKGIYLSENGDIAAIVTGNPNGYGREDPENEITLIRLPGSLPKDAAVGTTRYSVAKLQQSLKNAGEQEVKVDGILGPETLTAIAKYWEDTKAIRLLDGDPGSDALIKGILPNWTAAN